jgi:hypothetical protein
MNERGWEAGIWGFGDFSYPLIPQSPQLSQQKPGGGDLEIRGFFLSLHPPIPATLKGEFQE